MTAALPSVDATGEDPVTRAAAARSSPPVLSQACRRCWRWTRRRRSSPTAARTTWPGRSGDCGFEMVLSRYVPRILRSTDRRALRPSLHRPGPASMDWSQIDRRAVHPGGRAILDQVQRALRLSDEQLAPSRAVLGEHGNMSSATVLFILRRILHGNGELEVATRLPGADPADPGRSQGPRRRWTSGSAGSPRGTPSAARHPAGRLGRATPGGTLTEPIRRTTGVRNEGIHHRNQRLHRRAARTEPDRSRR